MAEIPKVHEDQFKAVIRALLNSPPKPLKEISPETETTGPQEEVIHQLA